MSTRASVPEVTSVLKQSPQECPIRHKSVSGECPTRPCRQSVLQECFTSTSRKSVPQDPTRGPDERVSQGCCRRVSHKSAPQECSTRVSYNVVPGFSTKVSRKSVPRECRARVLRTVFHKSVIQEHPTRAPPTRVFDKSHKSILQSMFGRLFSSVCVCVPLGITGIL